MKYLRRTLSTFYAACSASSVHITPSEHHGLMAGSICGMSTCPQALCIAARGTVYNALPLRFECLIRIIARMSFTKLAG